MPAGRSGEPEALQDTISPRKRPDWSRVCPTGRTGGSFHSLDPQGVLLFDAGKTVAPFHTQARA